MANKVKLMLTLPATMKRMEISASPLKRCPLGRPQSSITIEASAAESIKTIKPIKRSISTLAAASAVRRVSLAKA